MDITVTCSDQVHKFSHDQAMVNVSTQPARHGPLDKLQLDLTGTRTKSEPKTYESAGTITVSLGSWADLLADMPSRPPRSCGAKSR